MKSVILLLLTLLCFASVAQEKTADDFSLPDLEGNNFRLSENIGEGPVLINFWATWCIPCKAEMKKLKLIYKKYKDQGLKILSITIDDPKTVSRVRGFVKKNRYPFTILLDTNSEVFQLYQGTYPPLSILIDNNGKIVYRHVGYRKGDEKKLEKYILSLLESKPDVEERR